MPWWGWVISVFGVLILLGLLADRSFSDKGKQLESVRYHVAQMEQILLEMESAWVNSTPIDRVYVERQARLYKEQYDSFDKYRKEKDYDSLPGFTDAFAAMDNQVKRLQAIRRRVDTTPHSLRGRPYIATTARYRQREPGESADINNWLDL